MPPVDYRGVVVYRRRAPVDAIDEYARRLVSALDSEGIAARYVDRGPRALDGRPGWVLLQYNPNSYGRSGIAPRLVLDVHRLVRRTDVRLFVMVHEAWLDMRGPKSTALGMWQRVQLRALLTAADRVVTSTETLARLLGARAIHLPPSTNIDPVATTPIAAREGLGLQQRFVVTLFGRGNPTRALDYAERAVDALAARPGAAGVTVLNLGAGAPPIDVPPGVELRSPGHLPADALSRHLWASHLVLLPFADGLSTRRTTMMAALAHRRPVIGLEGRNTDRRLLAAARDGAVVLAAAGDRAAFAAAAVQLADDPAKAAATGDRGEALFRAEFDWPVLARRMAGLIVAAEPAEAALAA